MKVICINPTTWDEFTKHGIRPLVFMKVYEVVEEIEQPKGLGYVLQGVDNSHIIIVDSQGRSTGEPVTYHSRRFIPISDIDETETISNETSIFNA
jgi:hypothetical protein